MIIEEKDFKLIPINDSSLRYDLELLYKIQPKGKESRLEFKNVAYGISIDYAIKKIVQHRICCKHKDEAITLQTYFKEFKEELDLLKNYVFFKDSQS